MNNIIIGTAGHIDHGKTTLIKALTGRETDTLAEEKKRGISINLGFTYFDLPNKTRVGIVDVPGHEKFIKNMLAGASSVDLVLLVVAADEGVMPQTVEHLDILSFLNVEKGIIVLTKSEKVDEDFREMVKEDIIEKTKDTFIEGCEIIEVDSISGYGMDNLINKIQQMSETIEEKNKLSPSRINIDRVFSAKGFGTIITGTLQEGVITVDDELVVYPKNLRAKVRSIQVHGQNVEKANAGQRTAINLSNIKVDEIERGDVLAKENSLEETMMIDVKLSIVKHATKALKHWDRLRLYHGTREILCRAVPLECEVLEPGESGFVQLRLEESIVVKKGDPFVVRNYSPLETIGGGIIIDTANKKYKKQDENVINILKIKEKGELKDIIEQHLKKNYGEYLVLKDILTYSGETEEQVVKELDKSIEEKVVLKINNYYIHALNYEKLKDKAIEVLNEYHKKNRLKDGMLKEELRSKIASKLKTKDFDVLLGYMNDDNATKVNNNFVSIFEFEVKLNDKQIETKNIIQKQVKQAGINNLLTIKELSKDRYYEEVVGYMIGKTIEQLEDGVVIDKEIYDKAKTDLIDYLNKNKEIGLGEYRDILNTSRKNAVILLEHFDRIKVTKRMENTRVLF